MASYTVSGATIQKVQAANRISPNGRLIDFHPAYAVGTRALEPVMSRAGKVPQTSHSAI